MDYVCAHGTGQFYHNDIYDYCTRAKNTVNVDESVWEKSGSGKEAIKRQPAASSDQRDAPAGPYIQK